MALGRSEQADNGEAADPEPAPTPERLAHEVPIERMYDPDEESMLAALRVVLKLPRVPRGRTDE